MAQLLNAEPKPFGRGDHLLKINHTSGNVQLQYKVEGESTFSDFKDSLYSATEEGLIMQICGCQVQALISGTAEVFLVEAGP